MAGSYPTWFPTLPCDAWNYCSHSTVTSFLKWEVEIEKADVIQTLLFVAGLSTLLQSLFGTRLPAVIGGSYTFVPTTISIILAGRFSDEVDPVEKFKRIMRAIQGALIVASTLQIVLGFSGLWRNVTSCPLR
uniref:Uncharacterized protein n=1 Tax=Salix viminalis TaxID=40686 RepID=A0A6N2LHF1_SALVM